LSDDIVFFEGSAELIASAFIPAPNAELVRLAMARAVKMNFAIRNDIT
jgi:hypothetical protein